MVAREDVRRLPAKQRVPDDYTGVIRRLDAPNHQVYW